MRLTQSLPGDCSETLCGLPLELEKVFPPGGLDYSLSPGGLPGKGGEAKSRIAVWSTGTKASLA